MPEKPNVPISKKQGLTPEDSGIIFTYQSILVFLLTGQFSVIYCKAENKVLIM